MDEKQAEYNRAFYEVVTAMGELRRPAVAQDTADLEAGDLDRFIDGRKAEADKLASALENGTLLTLDAREKAKARLVQIPDELKWADVTKKKLGRSRP